MTEKRVTLEVRDVIKQYKQYDETVMAVNCVSFKVYEGEFVAIIGASGSGKSTLLHMCAGIDRPNSGSIVIRGNKITDIVFELANPIALDAGCFVDDVEFKNVITDLALNELSDYQ